MLSYEMLRWFYRHATGGKRHGILMPLAAARSISSKKVAKGGGKNTCLACHVALQLPRKDSSPAATVIKYSLWCKILFTKAVF